MTVPRFGRRVAGVDLIVVLLIILVVLALVGSIAVSPLLWVLVIILVLFAVGGRGRYYGRRGGWLALETSVDRGEVFRNVRRIRLDRLHLWLGSSSLGRGVSATTHHNHRRPHNGREDRQDQRPREAGRRRRHRRRGDQAQRRAPRGQGQAQGQARLNRRQGTGRA